MELSIDVSRLVWTLTLVASVAVAVVVTEWSRRMSRLGNKRLLVTRVTAATLFIYALMFFVGATSLIFNWDIGTFGRVLAVCGVSCGSAVGAHYLTLHKSFEAAELRQVIARDF